MYKVYDFTKGGVDMPDQRMGSYMTKAKTRIWTLVAMAYLLDVVRVNAQTLFEFKTRVTENCVSKVGTSGGRGFS